MGTPWVSFNGKDCSGCEHLNERGYCEFTSCIIPCTVRATIPEVKPKTNGDSVRSMSDEELAILLTDVAKKSAEKLCESLKTVDVDLSNCDFGILYKAHLDWLRQECE